MRRKWTALFRSFAWAGRGIYQAVRRERNLRIHLCAGVFVFLLSLFYPFGTAEYALLALLVFGVIALELLNSALERAVDCASPHKSKTAGLAKDMAAGAVLAFCIGAAVCGVLLFGNAEALAGAGRWFIARPWRFVPLAALLAADFWFVFGLRAPKDEADGNNEGEGQA